MPSIRVDNRISVPWQLAINMAMISRWSVIYYVSRGATVQPNSSRRQFSDEFVGYVSRACQIGILTGEAAEDEKKRHQLD